MNPFISNTSDDINKMLQTIGVQSIDELFVDILPEYRPREFNLPQGKSEQELIQHFQTLSAKQNQAPVSFVGGGFYDHYVPSACSALISRGEFYTAYTPYQAEAAQGTLQSLFEFQSSICALTGMDVANSSVYEGGTALYEAMMMAIRLTGRKQVLIDEAVNPIYRKILSSYTQQLDLEIVVMPSLDLRCDRQAFQKQLSQKTAAVILQNPNFFGTIDDFTDLVQEAHRIGALAIASVYPISLGILKTPAEMDFDIVTGEGQSLGLPLSFGGPYLGLMATKKKYIRQMPGRIVGQTQDPMSRRCFVNTLQAREQHIRREKATSNICTNSALCAIQASIFMTLIGRQGLKNLATLNRDKSEFLKSQLKSIKGIVIQESIPTFNEFVIQLPCSADLVVEKMLALGWVAGLPLGHYYPDMADCLLIAITEKRTQEEISQYTQILKNILMSL